MARKEVVYVVELEGRDHGKQFRLVEMPAAQGERWACRALNAMVKANIAMPEGVMKLGMMGIAYMGTAAFFSMDFEILETLMKEMMNTSVKFIPNPAQPGTELDWSLAEGQVEEIGTIARLKDEVFRLHSGFSLAANALTLVVAAVTSGTLYSTSTSTSPPAPSAPSSPGEALPS